MTFASLDGGEVVSDSGLPFFNVLPGVDWRSKLRELATARRPELFERTLETNSADREAFVPLAALVNDFVADHVVEFARDWRADLVVYEYQFPAALVAAARLKVPAVQHDLGFVRTPHLRELMVAELAPAFDRHAISPPSQVDTIVIAPPSMITGEPYGWSMRPVPYNGDGTVPDRRSDRPRIAVTLGTVPPKVDGLDRIDRVVAAAAGVDAEFMLVMGEIDISELGGLPDNVHAVGWVPWDAVLRTCAAAIHHGGGGTTLTALAEGIPQLVLPDGSDRFINADAVRDRGAGLTATAQEIDTELLTRLLTDAELKSAASEVSAEISAMPSPADMVARLEVASG